MFRVICSLLLIALVNKPVVAMDFLKNFKRYSEKKSLFTKKNKLSDLDENEHSKKQEDESKLVECEKIENDEPKVHDSTKKEEHESKLVECEKIENDERELHDSAKKEEEDESEFDEVTKKGLLEQAAVNITNSDFPIVDVLQQIKFLSCFKNTWLEYVANNPDLYREDIRIFLDKEKLVLNQNNFDRDFKDSCEKILASNPDRKFYENLLWYEKIFGLLGAIRFLDQHSSDIPAYIGAGAPIEHRCSHDSDFRAKPSDLAKEKMQEVLAIALTKERYWFLFDLDLLQEHVEDVKYQQFLLRKEKIKILQSALSLNEEIPPLIDLSSPDQVAKQVLQEKISKPTDSSSHEPIQIGVKRNPISLKQWHKKRESMPPLTRINKSVETISPQLKKVPSTRVVKNPEIPNQRTQSTRNLSKVNAANKPNQSHSFSNYVKKLTWVPKKKKPDGSKTNRFVKKPTSFKNRMRSYSDPMI